MSADRYEITDNDASIRCQKPGKGPLILYSCDHDSSTQKIIAVIRQLQADLAAVTAERDLFSQMVADQRLVIEDLEHRRVKVCDENDALSERLAEIEKAPTVAVVVELSHMRDTWRQINYDENDLPEAGTELIARLKVQK